MLLQKSGFFPRILVFLITLSLLPGCQTLNSSMRDIGDYSRTSILQNVGVSDYVRINTTTGEVYAFEVDSLGENSLRGEGTVVNYNDIEQLEVRTSNAADSGGPNYVLYALIGVLIVAIIIAVSGSDSSGCSEGEFLCGLLDR